jgi:integrase
VKNYEFLFARFSDEFSDRELESITPDEILSFLTKITLPDPKSGKESEVVFIPQKVADRLKDYIKEKGIEPDQRIFPITYNAARMMVIKAGKSVGIHLRPHDLRRFCATYASRAGTPIEIVSKIVLRHAHLSTTKVNLHIHIKLMRKVLFDE